jgi:hypothetical protein
MKSFDHVFPYCGMLLLPADCCRSDQQIQECPASMHTPVDTLKTVWLHVRHSTSRSATAAGLLNSCNSCLAATIHAASVKWTQQHTAAAAAGGTVIYAACFASQTSSHDLDAVFKAMGLMWRHGSYYK